MIKVDINHLKFHSFNFDKYTNNLWNKNTNLLKEKVIKDELVKKIKHIRQFQDFNELNNDLKNDKNYHSFDYSHKEKLIESVIKKCHPKLYSELKQLFFEYYKLEKLNIYQIKLDSRRRLICVIENDTIYPLIFDLKHCFYKCDKNYDNNEKREKYEWDFKNEQNELKRYIIDYSR